MSSCHDVLVLREGVTTPATIGTSSPRRQQQVARLFPAATFTEIRGNVDTRLKKIATGVADATILAGAGLKRLRIEGWPGVVFRPLTYAESVPAVGQGAIAVQCTEAKAALLAPTLDGSTAKNVRLERAFQAALGAGCQIAFGALATDDQLYFFHEQTGPRTAPLRPDDFLQPAQTAARLLNHFGLHA
jgi:hydroxymethylbilane synthase